MKESGATEWGEKSESGVLPLSLGRLLNLLDAHRTHFNVYDLQISIVNMSVAFLTV